MTCDYPKDTTPDTYLTCIPDGEEILKIDKARPSEEGTLFPASIDNTDFQMLFDTGATKSVMSGAMYRQLRTRKLGHK